MAMQLNKSSSLNWRSAPRNMQVAAFAVLLSVSSKENKYSLDCNVRGCQPVQCCFTVQLARISNQILQGQGHMILKIRSNLQSEYLKT